jgi:hypothetical protein
MTLATSPAEALALSQGNWQYRPFNFDANSFFELPSSIYQLTLHASEKGWSSPIWLSAETAQALSFIAAPYEVPLPLWLPQCNERFRPLYSFLPEVQHTLLKNYRVPTGICDSGHVVLSMEHHRYLHGLTTVANADCAMMSVKPQFVWQNATRQFGPIFDNAWDIASPIIERSRKFATGSRPNKREIAPPHPRTKMWISLEAARHSHVAHREWSTPMPMSASAYPPSFAGLFYNACQFYASALLTEKTLEALEKMKTSNPKNESFKWPFVEHSRLASGAAAESEDSSPVDSSSDAHFSGFAHEELMGSGGFLSPSGTPESTVEQHDITATLLDASDFIDASSGEVDLIRENVSTDLIHESTSDDVDGVCGATGEDDLVKEARLAAKDLNEDDDEELHIMHPHDLLPDESLYADSELVNELQQEEFSRAEAYSVTKLQGTKYLTSLSGNGTPTMVYREDAHSDAASLLYAAPETYFSCGGAA